MTIAVMPVVAVLSCFSYLTYVFTRGDHASSAGLTVIPIVAVSMPQSVLVDPTATAMTLSVTGLCLVLKIILLVHVSMKFWGGIKLEKMARMHDFFGIEPDYWADMAEDERCGMAAAYYDGQVRKVCESAIQYADRIRSNGTLSWSANRIALLASSTKDRLDRKHGL